MQPNSKARKEHRRYCTNVPLYRTKLQLIIAPDVPVAARAYDVNGGESSEALTAWINGVISIIVTPVASPGTFAHEALHAAAEILRHCGVKYSHSQQETLAYLTGWITDWAARCARQHPGIRKKRKKV